MDLLKNFIYAGVGLAATTSDKLKETIDDLVEKGKISDTEGRKIVDDFFKTTDEKKEDFEAKMKKVQEDLAERFDFIKKDKKGDDVIDALSNRIEELEQKLAEAEKKVADAIKPKTASKSTGRKSSTTAKKSTTKK